MMYNEIKSGDIPILSFLKGTDYAMYVGPDLNPKQRELLKSKDIPVPVIYLPEILEQLSESVMKYNFPGVVMPEALSVESIYSQIRAEFEGRVTPESRIIVKYNGDVLVIYDAKDSFSLVVSYLINMCKPTSRPKAKISDIRFMECLNFDESLQDLYESLNEDKGAHENIRFRISESPIEPRRVKKEEIKESFEACYREMSSEESFDDEMHNALKEAEEMIKNLLLKGCPAQMILSWINQSIKLSRLKITKQFKIFMTDYDNQEIKMGPLPKTVFLFFLRHPEGVMFTHLQDYREELKMIYGHVCTSDDPQRMEESINRLIDPFDNSICEKCANVKKAFLVKVADNIAANYYVSGAQGEKKGISLDRSLVEWECEL
jgi:hypothetical protein